MDPSVREFKLYEGDDEHKEKPGPPVVMVFTSVNTLNEPIMQLIKTKKVVGETIGMVILKKHWIAFAPSISAAS